MATKIRKVKKLKLIKGDKSTVVKQQNTHINIVIDQSKKTRKPRGKKTEDVTTQKQCTFHNKCQHRQSSMPTFLTTRKHWNHQRHRIGIKTNPQHCLKNNVSQHCLVNNESQHNPSKQHHHRRCHHLHHCSTTLSANL